MKLTQREKRACKKFARLQGFTNFRGVRNADYVKFKREERNQYTEKVYHIDEIIERIENK